MGPLYYNSNGFAFHRLDDAARILADLGYDGLALTPDVHHLDPLRATPSEVHALRALCESLDLALILETGARFVLDPTRKHRPSLLDDADDAARRLHFLERCVDLARDLDAEVVTVWSGTAPDDLAPDAAHARLVDGLRRLCDYAAERRVRIGFEPEPGMLIETAAQWVHVRDAVQHEALGLTLDVGHCLANAEGDPADIIREHAADLLVLQLDDHHAGVHDHLAFGEGEVKFASVAAAVRDAAFTGPLEVELSRHSATAPATAAASLTFLRAAFNA